MRILLITHSDAYPNNAVTRDLAKAGHELVWRRPALGEVLPTQGIDAAISFGGPQYVTEIADFPWMQVEADWIKQFVDGGGHFLGICLGAQILSHAFGGKVWRYEDQRSEVGVYDVQPTKLGQEQGFLPDSASFYQWHLEGFECPEKAALLATSDMFPQQAFKLNAQTYGIQFHPEIDQTLIERWTGFVSEHRPEVFERPQVKQAGDHLPDWLPNADKISAWRKQFLANWLAA